MAEGWTRRIAHLGRPAASRTDPGSDRYHAAACLGEDGRASPGIAASAQAAAGRLQRPYQPPPAFERLVAIGGRVAGQRPHTLLACVAPPPVRTNARLLPGHRLVTWADRGLQRAPPGGAQRGAMVAQRRAALGDLPPGQARLQRWRRAAGARRPRWRRANRSSTPSP